MQKIGYATTLMFRAMQSGKTYKNEGRKGLEYSPLTSPPRLVLGLKAHILDNFVINL